MYIKYLVYLFFGLHHVMQKIFIESPTYVVQTWTKES